MSDSERTKARFGLFLLGPFVLVTSPVVASAAWGTLGLTIGLIFGILALIVTWGACFSPSSDERSTEYNPRRSRYTRDEEMAQAIQEALERSQRDHHK